MSNLIVVNDFHIRKQAFAAAARQLRKLERLEEKLKIFHEKDRRLFKDWYELTFREKQRQMENLRGEYLHLAEFYNWMNAIVDLENVSLPEAAFRLRQEQLLYAQGSAEERRTIEERRRLRDEYIRTRTEQSYRAAKADARHREFGDDTQDEDDDLIEDSEDLEMLAGLEDEQLEGFCADPETAFMILGDCLKSANESDDFQLFFRVWDMIHANHQKMFADAYRKAYGKSLFAVLEEMRMKTNSGGGGNAKTNPDEALKLTYRQLVRKLHPDMAGGPLPEDDWRRLMWGRVQEAYQKKNLHLMNRLFHIALLRAGELADLRVGDLKISHAWLADEIDETEASIRDFRKQFAWGFSRRKELITLKKRIEVQLAKDREKLEAQVVDLRTHLAFLEELGREARTAGHQIGPRVKRPVARARRSAQMSMFDEDIG